MTDEYLTDVEKIVKVGSKYTPSPIEKSISCSQIGSDILQLYLAKTNKIEEPFEVSQASIGSIFHLGMEEAAKNFSKQDNNNIIHIEHDMSKQLSNGWTLTGTADLITKEGNSFVIKDHKLTKQYTAKMVREAIRKHQPNGYISQMNGYRFLFNPEADMVLSMFYKDQDVVKSELAFEEIMVPYINDIEKQVINITNQLQHHLDTKTTPPKCADLWWRKPKNSNTSIPSRCKFYCNVSESCPYNNEYKATPRTMAKRNFNW